MSDGVPPLIDRAVFFGNPEIAGGQISPDGRFVSFLKPLDGVLNIWVKRIEEPFEAARPVTEDTTRPVTSYLWSKDSRLILYAQDKGGDENFRVYAVDPQAEARKGCVAPTAHDLTPYDDVRAEIYSVPKSDPGHILIGLNDRDPELHDVYRLDIRDGNRERVFTNRHNVSQWVADLDGNLRIAGRMTDDGGTELLRVEGDELVSVLSCTAEETCMPLRFDVDGRRLYLETNRGDADLTQLVLVDPLGGDVEIVESDPVGEVDFGGAIFSSVNDELMATYYVADRLRYYPREAGFAADLERAREALPDGDLGFRSMTLDGRLMLVDVSADIDPASTYIFDRETGTAELLYRTRPDVPSHHMASMQPIRYTARDGVEIPAYLTLPKGLEPGPLPVVIHPHGGPWVRDVWGFNSIVQFLANRGYAVLQPNFRGSTGYGKRFLNLGNNEWGTGSMQHDITDGVQHLIEQGIADPDRVAILGGSYGGYATLAGLTFTPDVYAAGVSIVGPSSILTLLESIPPYWVPLIKVFSVRVGDPENPDDLARLKSQSPLYSASQITAPLLVIQGANDPRVKQAESDQIVVALRDLGRIVEYLVATDEGHGFAGEENSLAMFAAIERFLTDHLGGRYQEELTSDLSGRLERLTVDVDALGIGGSDAESVLEPSDDRG